MWAPWIAVLYGVRPWEMSRVTASEYLTMLADLERKNEEASRR